MRLSDRAISNAVYKEKSFKITDGKGLYLLVGKTGKYFRFDYRFDGKRKTLALGVYPVVKLAVARALHLEARRQLADGIDPGQHRKTQKIINVEQAANSFEVVAREWFSKNSHIWTEGHSQTVISRLERDVFPFVGGRPIAQVNAPELLSVLRKVEYRGAIETAHRINQICGKVFRYAIATGRAGRDPSADLKGALPPTKSKRMATITEPKKVGELLRAIEGYEGNFVTRGAFRLAPLVFVRPGELRHAEWSEIDLEKAEWKIPAEKMKMRTPHMVALSKQAVAILREIQPITGRGRYAFPSLRTIERPMSENTLLGALRRLGYAKEEMSVHGFRATASTLLNENGWSSDLIERQLAHTEKNNVRAAYNHAQNLPERREMMQWWADYLDELKGDKT